MNKKLERISDLFWKPLNVEIHGRALDAFLFDLSKAGEDDYEVIVEDTFGDGIPEELDLNSKIPFAGLCNIEQGEFTEGNFDVMPQPDYMLFADIESGKENEIPIYLIEIDGTAIEETFIKIADDIGELDFKHGLINT